MAYGCPNQRSLIRTILAVGTDGFGVIQLAGQRLTLREFASWRTDEERRRQHELTTGDVNGDGCLDLVSLDAGDQMCEIFTLSQIRDHTAQSRPPSTTPPAASRSALSSLAP